MECYLVDKNKFFFKVDYSKRLAAKKYGLKWDLNKRSWYCDANKLNYFHFTRNGAVFPKEVQEYMGNSLSLSLSPTSFQHEERVKGYPHQTKLTQLVLQKKRCFFLCDMGTGKTKAVIDSICILLNQGKIKKALVVCPASITYSFQTEVRKHSFLESTIINGEFQKRIQKLNIETPIHIINYEILHSIEPFLTKIDYEFIVFDECHRIKNRMSKVSRSSYTIAKKMEYRVGMTGTLYANSSEDIFMPYKVIAPEIFGTLFTRFRENFLVYGGFENRVIVDYKNKDLFKKLLSSNALKYNLDDVKELPKSINVIKDFDLRIKTKNIYSKLKKEFVVDYEKKIISSSNVLDRIIKLSQLTSGFIKTEDQELLTVGDEKIKLLKSILMDIKGKAIVWCRFRHSIKNVAQACTEMGLTYMTYHGDTVKKDQYETFNKDDTNVWIAQIRASEGYNLPSAKYSIFFELDYSRVTHNQARGRNRRLHGSENGACVYIYLIAKNTVDECIYKILKEKDFKSSEALQYISG